MRYFDYSFLKDLKVPSNFLTLTNIIYSINKEEEQRKKEYPNIFTNLQKIAIVQSVKGSNAIEGIVTTDKRIEEIVNQNSNPLNHNEEEILGYKEALSIIHNNYESLQFEIDTIKELHSILLQHTSLEYRGRFKREDNIIYEKYSDGSSKVRFEPVKANETEKAMEQLIIAYKIAKNDSSINQLLLIPCVILDFLCIHPFQDGNGRLSRLLSLLLMYKNNFDVSKYISFEEQINKNKANYYEALRTSSIYWHDNKNDYIPFISDFLFTLYLCYLELDKRFLTIKSGKVSKNKRIEEVVLSSIIPISKKQIKELLPDISISTIERVLSNLISDNKISKIGSTNKARYFRNNKK